MIKMLKKEAVGWATTPGDEAAGDAVIHAVAL
jgi:hypothetical protein